MPSPSSSGSAERYALMWSGGKDSALALMRARASGLDVGRLLNFYDPATDRVPFHAMRSDLIRAQADAIGIELRQLGTPWERYEATFRDMLAELKREGFAGVVFGDIHLADVRAWYEERVRAAGLAHVEPIWGERGARRRVRRERQPRGDHVLRAAEAGRDLARPDHRRAVHG